MVDAKEIATEIVNEIKKANSSAGVSQAEILAVIGKLKKPKFFGYRKNNAEFAREVIAWVKMGQKLLAGRPETYEPALLICRTTDSPNIALRASAGLEGHPRRHAGAM
jgi:hypothetical protein